MKISSIVFLIFLVFSACNPSPQEQLSADSFKNPPQSAQVHTWWHWISGNITKDGITKDLESMKQQGISEATILNIGGFVTVRLEVPEVKFNSPEWVKMFQFSLTEANRLGITIGVHNCEGWSTSGGPWITPEKSMKKYAWTKAYFDGGQEINIQLEQPQAVQNYYRDYAVIAYPVEEKTRSSEQFKPSISLNDKDTKSIFFDGNPLSKLNVNTGNIISIAYPSTYSCNKLVLFPNLPFTWNNMETLSSRFSLSSSADGKTFKKVADLEFVGLNKSIEATFPPTKAKFFQLECLDCEANYPVAELELLNNNESPSFAPGISNLLEKTVSVNTLRESYFDKTSYASENGIAENLVLDLTGSLSPEGVLNWDAPKGRWCVIRFGYTTTGKTNAPATPEGVGLECDKMDASAVDDHFEGFSKQLINAAGKYSGNTFKFLLIDSWEAEFQNWTEKFPQEFEKRRGYSIIPWIPVLCGDLVDDVQLSEAFLNDFRKTIADLIDENYYKRYSDLCHENNLKMHAEVIYGNNGGTPPLDIIKSNRYADMPMTEFWANPNADQFPEYRPSSMPTPGFPMFSALTANKQIIGSEAYTGFANYSESPTELKPFGDAAFCSGVNQMIFHSYVHQPFDKKPGVTLNKFAAHFNRNNPWWEFAHDWLKYQARVQYVLQKGEPVADVIFYVGDQLPEYFSKTILYDLPYGYKAFPCNFDMLLNQAKVIDGRLSFGGKQSFPLLALPKSTAMNFETLQRIAQLVNDGLVLSGPKPLEMISVLDIKNNSNDFEDLTAKLWGNSTENNYGSGKVISGLPIKQVLTQLEIQPDFATDSNEPLEILYIHKIEGNSDVYFVFNQQNTPLKRDLLFKIDGKTPEIWNAENGNIFSPVEFHQEKDYLRIPVAFAPHESLIFIFKNEASAKSIDKQLVQTDKIELENLNAKLVFFPISNETIEPIEIAQLKSLTELDNPAIKYFAGKVKYTITFDVTSNTSSNEFVALNLGNLSATAEVKLNGNLLGFAWKPNSEYDVSGILKAQNLLEITIANVCRNRFIGDLIQYGEVKSLFTTSPITTILNKDMPLKASGLIGPLKLVKYN